MSRTISGGSMFQSVADIIQSGTDAMEPGSVVMLENFSLQDSMSAVEIMDARMDIGMTTEQSSLMPFDPLRPLLPEELCWILDKAMACEMTWHIGYTLSQTVYTCRYVHHINELGMDTPKGLTNATDDLRKIVLRAALYGLLKCCDISWRELSKGNLHDTEDWNSEKAEVSLLEGTQLPTVFDMLHNAIIWLETSSQLASSEWREGLIARMKLRKDLLQILAATWGDLSGHIASAKSNLQYIASKSLPEVSPLSQVRRAFDHAVNKNLPSFLPLPQIDSLSPVETWQAIDGFLSARRILIMLEKSDSVLEWEVTSTLRIYKGIGRVAEHSPYIRALAMSIFYSDNKILGRHTPAWAVDQLFLEMGNVPPGTMFKIAEREHNRSLAKSRPSMQRVDEFERDIAKLIVHIQTSWYHSRARQRREFANAILHWQVAYEEAVSLAQLLKQDHSQSDLLSRLPLILQYYRLLLVKEVVFSGFELELYATHEMGFIYWYIVGPLRIQCDIIRKLIVLMQNDRNSKLEAINRYLRSQLVLLDAIALLSQAFARLSIRITSPPAVSQQWQKLNMMRRFKWAFVPGHIELQNHDFIIPDFEGYQLWKSGALSEEDWLMEFERLLTEARQLLTTTPVLSFADPPFQLCVLEHGKLLDTMKDVCDMYLACIRERNVASIAASQWTGQLSWFPIPK